MNEPKSVLLSLIDPDPKQPRKFFDPTAEKEMAESAKKNGILQQILLRPHPDKRGRFLIVYGERRFRAAGTAGLTEIPAQVRELTDEQALEIQIIENLQRKDVHPMEEAAAIKSLVDSGKSMDEAAAVMGKSIFFVRQRNRLCSLEKNWQEVYFLNLIESSEALAIAQFSETDQQALYKRSVRKSGKDLSVDNLEWSLRNMSGKLEDATFDKKDPLLNPEMGACTNCPFNTAVSSLFPEDAKHPVCKKLECFSKKTNTHFVRMLNDVLQDPTFLMISDSWSASSDKHVAEVQKKHTVLFEKEYDAVGGYDARYYATREGLEAKASSGTTKAFMLDGSNKGKFVYIKLKSKSSGGSGGKTTAAKTKEKLASGKATAADIEAEINRINEREKRSKQIDAEALWSVIKNLDIDQDPNLYKRVPFTSGAFTQEERNAIGLALMEELHGCDAAYKAIGVKGRYIGDAEAKKLQVSDQQIFHLLRLYMMDKLFPGTSHIQSTNPSILMPVLMSKNYIPEKIKELEAEFAPKIAKRQGNVVKRLEQLKEQKKKLATPVAKKAAPKKAEKKIAPKKVLKSVRPVKKAAKKK